MLFTLYSPRWRPILIDSTISYWWWRSRDVFWYFWTCFILFVYGLPGPLTSLFLSKTSPPVRSNLLHVHLRTKTSKIGPRFGGSLMSSIPPERTFLRKTRLLDLFSSILRYLRLSHPLKTHSYSVSPLGVRVRQRGVEIACGLDPSESCLNFVW